VCRDDHSYWFLVAPPVFEGVLQQDPGCAIAYWGICAGFFCSATRWSGRPRRENANAAWAALEKARERFGAKTDREPLRLDRRDTALTLPTEIMTRPDVENPPCAAYNSAMEQMAQALLPTPTTTRYRLSMR